MIRQVEKSYHNIRYIKLQLQFYINPLTARKILLGQNISKYDFIERGHTKHLVFELLTNSFTVA